MRIRQMAIRLCEQCRTKRRLIQLGSFSLAVMFAVSCARSVAQTTATPAQSSSQPAPSALPLSGSFGHRLAQYYAEDWMGTLPSSPAPEKRGLPSPLDSPPFPSSDWSYGGSSDIGAPDSNGYPLSTALRIDNRRSKLLGWIGPGLDFSTSSRTNTPEVYDATPDRLEFNQGVIIYTRLPDTIQTKKFDWGFQITGLYGTDYRYTTAKGYISTQLLKYNHQYGVDLPIEYVDLYFPGVAQGMNLRIGRFISVPGIEAQLSPNNYMFSHSILYYIDPFTDTGAIATFKLNPQWLLQTGITAGHDVAPWTSDAKPSATVCLDYTTRNVNNNFYLCANGINSAKFAYDNVQQYDATWYHRFSKTWHIASESWFMYQRDVPNIAPQILHPLYVQSGAYGANCYGPAQTCLAQEYAAENYIEHEVNSKLMLSFRSELVDDKKGQRTGYATKYTENTLSATRYIGSTITVRPEIRFEHSWDRKAYNDGRASNQFTVAADLVYHF